MACKPVAGTLCHEAALQVGVHFHGLRVVLLCFPPLTSLEGLIAGVLAAVHELDALQTLAAGGIVRVQAQHHLVRLLCLRHVACSIQSPRLPHVACNIQTARLQHVACNRHTARLSHVACNIPTTRLSWGVILTQGLWILVAGSTVNISASHHLIRLLCRPSTLPFPESPKYVSGTVYALTIQTTLVKFDDSA